MGTTHCEGTVSIPFMMVIDFHSRASTAVLQSLFLSIPNISKIDLHVFLLLVPRTMMKWWLIQTKVQPYHEEGCLFLEYWQLLEQLLLRSRYLSMRTTRCEGTIIIHSWWYDRHHVLPHLKIGLHLFLLRMRLWNFRVVALCLSWPFYPSSSSSVYSNFFL